MWTLDELVDRVGRALTGAYPGAPNGRVRDVPDRRAIRWYTTTGLVDRPLGMRGRTALYGPRHLLQLVALKRRQAAGRTLAQIQAELGGATDADLAQVALVPAELLVGDGPAPDPGAARTRFWATAPGRATGAPASPAGTPASPAGAPAEPAVPPSPMSPAPPPLAPSLSPAPRALGGVVLGRGAILVFPGAPTDADRAALAAAARPLLDLLADRGLLEPENGSPS